MSGKPRVLLMGAYGQDNLGDEALLEVHLQQLSDHPITVVSSDPDQTRARYQVDAVRTYGEDQRARLRAFARSDVLVYGGGSLLKELPPPFFRYRLVANLAAASLAARASGKGVVFSSMGVERLPSAPARFLARRAAGASHLFLARDEGSRRKLEGIGARGRIDVVADAAFLLEADGAARRRATAFFAPLAEERVVALNPISSLEVGVSRQDVARSFAALAERLRAEGARVLWMPFKTRGVDNDLDVLDDIARLSPDARDLRAPLDLRPAEMLAFLARCDAFVGMRHHGVLLAVIAGTTTVAVPYAEKTENFVAESGLAAYAVNAAALSPESLLAVYGRAMAEREIVQALSSKALAAFQERARMNFRLLREFLRTRAA